MKIDVLCKGCGLNYKITKPELELQFQMGRDDFYCNAFCYQNFITNRYYIYEYRNCLKEDCLSLFSTRPSSPKLYCSRGCASANSVTNYRREKAKENTYTNLVKGRQADSIANGLRTREMWKYVEISKLLNEKNIFHEFEFPLMRFVFDLALFEQKILIEFDGSYHDELRQKPTDYEKVKTAFTFGWNLKRIKTPSNEILSSDLILQFI